MMSDRIAPWTVAALGAFILLGCRARKATVNQQASPAASASGAGTVIQPVALHSVLAAAAQVAPSAVAAVETPRRTKPPRVEMVSDKTGVHCMSRVCQVGSETCCRTTDEGMCVSSVRPGPADDAQPLVSQIEACNAKKLPFAIDTIARCDESIDCGEAEACCAQFIYGGMEASLCVPIKKKGLSPCGWHEVCVESSSCRTPGAVCVNGACQKPVASLPCGDTNCTAPNNVCCLDGTRCGLPTDCPTGCLRCAHPDDCLKGQFCEVSFLGTQCTGQVAWGAATSVCDSDKDCRGLELCKPAHCVPSKFSGIKQCHCESSSLPAVPTLPN
jgi:hypothetical protein